MYCFPGRSLSKRGKVRRLNPLCKVLNVLDGSTVEKMHLINKNKLNLLECVYENKEYIHCNLFHALGWHFIHEIPPPLVFSIFLCVFIYLKILDHPALHWIHDFDMSLISNSFLLFSQVNISVLYSPSQCVFCRHILLKKKKGGGFDNGRGLCFLIIIHKLEHDMDGRIMILDVPIKDFHLCLVNIYGPNNSTPIFF